MAVSHQPSKAVAYIREIVFGLEDSLVSTLGTVTGIAVGTRDSYVVILSGMVLIAVESISMAAGSFLSSEAADEVGESNERPLLAGAIMFVSYVLGGMIPLTPYLLLSVSGAFAPSIVLTIVALFFVGAWKGRVTNGSWWKSGLKMTAVSLTAAALGYAIGWAASQWAGVRV